MKRIKTLLKILLVAGLLYVLGDRGLLSFEKTHQAFVRFEFTGFAFLALFTTTFLAILRWQILLRSQEIHLSSSRILQLGFVGNFFNTALPGAVSGDVVKAIYVAREVETRRSHALSSILFDRVAGVAGLILLAMGALALSLNQPWGDQLLSSIQIFLGISGAGLILFFSYLFLVRENFDPLLHFMRKLESKFRIAGSLVRIYEGLMHFHKTKGAVLLSLFISLLIHLLVVTACIYFARALDETHVDALAFFILVPLGLLVTAIPVMPAGIGTGHAAFVYLFHLLGSEAGANIYSLFVIYKLIEGAAGGLVYLKFKSERSLPKNLPESY